ncbi:MAG: hypothetical protein ACF8XB_11550 [Planctomycetota bacterium JB042]
MQRSRFVAPALEDAVRALADDPDPFVAATARSVAMDRRWIR